MKLGHACTFPNKPRGETPAPLAANRAPALPRPLARRAPSSQIAGRVCHAVLAVLRAMDAASILRLAGTVLAQALHAWRPSQRHRPASCPPAGRRRAASPQQARFRLSGAFRLRFGYPERQESTQKQNPFFGPRLEKDSHKSSGYSLPKPGMFA